MPVFKSLAQSIPYDTFSSLLDQGYIKYPAIIRLVTHMLVADVGYIC